MVNVDDRVGITRSYTPSTTEQQEIFDAAAAGAAKFFTNGFDTESRGLDIVIDHKTSIGANGTLNNILSGTFSKTEVKNVKSILGTEILDETLKGILKMQCQELR
ncbi:hypothetical protein JCM19274_3337 [Algibacter lectus]|uniref:Uncharacterized protein n=3 Tax=Algibacter lectus TaxID=221126 RepID=A0A090WTQ2_9FLAO|nr:hypothetical protein [Algibacter lectus]GAL78779.1 hypothetical protein JCM19274_3337 [Algibacter lectus]